MVDIEAVGHGVPTLKYLAPYVHRVAINNSRIVSVDAQSVTYKIRRSKTNRVEIKRVDGEVFVESFLQHVLPRGFQKVRHVHPSKQYPDLQLMFEQYTIVVVVRQKDPWQNRPIYLLLHSKLLLVVKRFQQFHLVVFCL